MHRTARPSSAWCAVLGLLTACTGTGPGPRPEPPPDETHTLRQPPAEPVPPDLARAAEDLVSAAPDRWAATCAELRRLDASPSSLAAALVAALDRNSTGPGSAPAIALLGSLPGTTPGTWLLRTLDEPSSPRAIEAALALGRRPADDRAAQRLQELLRDRAADRTLRTCAAASLLDWGVVGDAAPFLHAVLLGGTPQGRDAMQRFGLPDDTRWALERSIAIAAIDRWAGRPQAYALDPDLPWPLLQERADRFLAEAMQEDRGGAPR